MDGKIAFANDCGQMGCKRENYNDKTSIMTPKKRPPLAILKRGTSVVPSPEVQSASSSRESAFTFHQNLRASFLFGKNNVFAYTGDREAPGYLSLHQDFNRLLVLRWIPNVILLSKPNSIPSKSPHHATNISSTLSIKIEKISHLHLHQKDTSSSIMIVLIDADGVQQFAFSFTLEQHCLSFLSSLETGLWPLFKIEPPLNSVKIGELFAMNATPTATNANSNASHFRKLNSPDSLPSKRNGSELVFRIVSFASPSFDQKVTKSSPLFSRSSTQESRVDEHKISLRESLSNATKAMQSQILSRAFIGWVSYCRHLRTIRLNLATIMTIDGFVLDSDGMELPVNEASWRICRSEKTIALYKQFLTRVYFCGVEPDLRTQVWPYLLRLVNWHEDLDIERLGQIENEYKADLEEWVELESKFTTNGDASDCRNSECVKDDGVADLSQLCHSISLNSDVFEENGGDALGKSTEMTLLKEFEANMLRIQKDVDRCDRSTRFYAQKDNLEQLRRVITTYIYRRLRRDPEDGYVQGMCDLIAPLLVVLGGEALTLACFERLMGRMRRNFPQSTHNNGMEENLNNFRSLVEVMDPELYCQLMRNIDYSFVVFYRWLLLDFKRELVYSETFRLWEVIWAAEMSCSRHFELFFGLALLTQYREVLIENDMDFTDVIKFFNEMAEKHNLDELLEIARVKLRAFQAIVHDLKS